MGLDMYLKKKIYIGANYKHREVKGIIEIESKGEKIQVNLNKVSYIEEEVGYWRKANHIHKWFVDNVQDGNDDCKDYYVGLSELKELRELCKEVVEKCSELEEKELNDNGTIFTIKVIKNADVAADLLPTTSGFFFGTTNYDEYYLSDTIETIEILDNAIKELESENGKHFDIIYTSSW